MYTTPMGTTVSELDVMMLSFVAVVWSLFAIAALFKVLDYGKVFYQKKGNLLLKSIFFFPYLALWFICFAINLILVILGGMLFISGANSARDWWHKGK